MKVTKKYWRVARALALHAWGDADIADHILEAATGASYEPEDEEIGGPDLGGCWHAAQCAEPRELPDYVEGER